MRLRLTLDAVVLFDLAMFEPETAEDPAEGIQGAPPQSFDGDRFRGPAWLGAGSAW